jgi:polyphosphate kinase 2 (PPK2 family)
MRRLPRLMKSIWKERCWDIRQFEEYLTPNGTVVRKVSLNISKGEQPSAFSNGSRTRTKTGFSAQDVAEREYCREYMNAYDDTIRATATSPWYVVPADNKWFARIVIAAAVAETLDSMNLEYPQLTPAQQKELKAARAALV